MNKVKTMLFLLLSISFCGCNQDSEINTIEENIENFISIDIPKNYKAESLGERTSENEEDIDDVTLDVKVTVNGKEVIGKIRMVVHSDNKLSYFAVSENIVEGTTLSPNYWVEAYQGSLEGGRITKITGKCDCSGYDKGDGREKCRANCIIGIATTIIIVIVLL
jgi:hypothetical protein